MASKGKAMRSYREMLWASSQRSMGRADARAGRRASMADEHYQRGYREGSSPCRCANMTVHEAEGGCQRKAITKSRGLCRHCEDGHN